MDDFVVQRVKRPSRRFILWFLVAVALAAWSIWLVWTFLGAGSYDLPRAARSLSKVQAEARRAGLLFSQSDLPKSSGASVEDVVDALQPIAEFKGNSVVFFAGDSWKDRSSWSRFAAFEKSVSKVESIKQIDWKGQGGYWRGPDQQVMPRLQKTAKYFSVLSIEHAKEGRDAECLRAFQNALHSVRLMASQNTIKSVYFATISEESVLTTIPILLEEGIDSRAILNVLDRHAWEPSPALMIREEAWHELNSMPRMLRRGRLSYMGTSVDPLTLEMSGSMIPVDGERALNALQARSLEFWTALKELADRGASMERIRDEAEVLRQAAEDSRALSRVRVAALELQVFDHRRFETTAARQAVARGLVQAYANPNEPLPIDPAAADPLRAERAGGTLKVWSRGRNSLDDLARGDDVVMSVKISDH